MGIIKKILLAVSVLFAFVKGQNEVCKFYHQEANCRYKIDGICLSEITASIDQCTDPIQVKFTITCERNPVVRFSHTFSAADTLVTVRGFYQDVRLRVKLRMKESDLLNVEADLLVYELPDTDLINDDIKIHSLEEACGSLNNAGKIAIGVMAGLFVIAGILLVVLLWIRRQRRIQKATQTRSVLVNEPDTTQERSPPRLSTIEENGFEDRANTQNTVQNNATSSSRISGEGTHTDHSRSREISQINTQQVQHGRDRVNNSEPSVRYSDILRQENT